MSRHDDMPQKAAGLKPSKEGPAGEQFLSILRQYWGYDSFRGIQLDIIRSIAAGRDTLGLMPTGGGKSITFQVPALAAEGMCLVISPLIALMKDQVESLRRRGIRAQAIYTGMTHVETLTVLDNCAYGNFKFLYVAPERIGSELFQARLRHMNISFITVDEAHCISQWGYDFRPAYTQISAIRRLVPHAPILALTASATPPVVEDIQRQLLFRERNVFSMSFARTNLIYNVRRVPLVSEEGVRDLLMAIPGPSIIYARSRIKTEDLATWLVRNGISATFYHAGLPPTLKAERQEAFLDGRIRVMVATNAFGMGIDKPDVRSVIHIDVPDSPEAYFQEAGRAGRDGAQAYAILLADSHSTATLRRRIEETYPPLDYVRKVYEDMCYFLEMAMGDGQGVTREFDLQLFSTSFRHFPVRAYNAMQLLSRAGYIEWIDPEEGRSRVLFRITRDSLYGYDLPRTEDRVVYSLLRNYTGLFSEYVFISEALLAHDLGIPEEDVSQALINLSRAHVITFIPRKFIPRITFLQRRVETEEIVLPPAIYDDRRRQMENRVETMIGYLETSECHSRYLLSYFGEKDAHDCGLCDNCIGSDEIRVSIDPDRLCQRITDFLASHGPTPITGIRFDDVPSKLVAKALHEMLREELLEYADDVSVRLPES